MATSSMAQDLAVSFVAPDGTPDGGVYGLHMRTPEEARVLAALLLQAGPSEAQVQV